MSPALYFRDIALRLRSLISESDLRDIDTAAARLGVGAECLRRSIDPLDPHPSVTVLVAIVREYGADPAWLLYGRYDRITHYEAIDKGEAITPDEFLALAESPRFVRPDHPPEERPRFQLDA